MDRKNITIREDQTEWVRRADVNLSRFVQDRLDEAMGPSDDELEAAYRENAEQARQAADNWEHVSSEANQYLGDAPAIEGNRLAWDPENGLRDVTGDSGEEEERRKRRKQRGNVGSGIRTGIE